MRRCSARSGSSRGVVLLADGLASLGKRKLGDLGALALLHREEDVRGAALLRPLLRLGLHLAVAVCALALLRPLGGVGLAGALALAVYLGAEAQPLSKARLARVSRPT
eukprot:scaffold121917_cov60-Phaeocystis_antarctica.AAC.1